MPRHETPPPELDRAFARQPRVAFLPRWQVRHAHTDQPLDIGHGQTCSQPSTVRDLLALLDVTAGQRVLDVGSGSAWTTALLAELVGPGGEVVGVEVRPELVESGAANLAARELPWARVQEAVPGVLGLPDLAPYDRVLVSAQARTVPQALVDQLVAGGVLVVPVRGELLRVVRRMDGGTDVSRHGSYRFVPLVLPPSPPVL